MSFFNELCHIDYVQLITMDGTLDIPILRAVDKSITIKVDSDNYYCEGDTLEFFVAISNRYSRCSGRVLTRLDYTDYTILILDDTAVINTIQRRNYCRESVLKTVYFETVDPSDVYTMLLKNDLEVKQTENNKTSTLDISGGGMRLITPFNIEEDTYILVNFTLYTSITCMCRVARSNKYKKGNIYSVSLEFVNIRAVNREEIINYVLNSYWINKKSDYRKANITNSKLLKPNKTYTFKSYTQYLRLIGS